MPAGDQRKLEQPAFDRAVEQRRLPRDLEVDELRQPQVAGEEERGPAGEVLLQRVAQQRIERARSSPGRRGARRTADWRAGCRGGGRGAREQVRAFDARRNRRPARRSGCSASCRPRRAPGRSRRSPAPAARRGCGRAPSASSAATPGRRTTASFWKPNVRASPGARSAAISAASTAIVPLPHIGSSSGTSGVHPASASRPAARFSRSGASSASRR